MGFQDDYQRGRKDEAAGRSENFKVLGNYFYQEGRKDEQNYQNMMWGKSNNSTNDSYQPSPHWERSSSGGGIETGNLVLIVLLLITIGAFALGQIHIAIVVGALLVGFWIVVMATAEG